jgi:hypothetical protein
MMLSQSSSATPAPLDWAWPPAHIWETMGAADRASPLFDKLYAHGILCVFLQGTAASLKWNIENTSFSCDARSFKVFVI